MYIQHVELRDIANNNSIVNLEMLSKDDALPKDELSPRVTLILAPNGLRKSSILRGVADYLLGSNSKPVYKSSRKLREVKTEIATFVNHSSDGFNKFKHKKIIAISGTASDRFPTKRRSLKNNNSFTDRYAYFGFRTDTNLISRRQTLNTLLYELVSKDSLSESNLSRINVAFNFLKYKPNLRFNIRQKQPFNTRFSQRDIKDTLFDEIINSKINDTSNFKEFASTTIAIANDFLGGKSFDPCEIIFSGNEIKKSKEWLTNDAIRLLVISGRISITDCEVLNDSNEWVDLLELSSGEFHLFSSVLGLALAVENDSIVLIDEPENSLHPAWQAQFLDLILQATKEISSVQFIIASHSPLIASSIPAQKSRVIVGGYEDSHNNHHEIIYRAEDANTYMKSSDELLVELFKLPSPRNFFFAEMVQKAVKLFSIGEIDTKEYRELQRTLSRFLPNLSDNDPIHDVLLTLINPNNN